MNVRKFAKNVPWWAYPIALAVLGAVLLRESSWQEKERTQLSSHRADCLLGTQTIAGWCNRADDLESRVASLTGELDRTEREYVQMLSRANRLNSELMAMGGASLQSRKVLREEYAVLLQNRDQLLAECGTLKVQIEKRDRQIADNEKANQHQIDGLLAKIDRLENKLDRYADNGRRPRPPKDWPEWPRDPIGTPDGPYTECWPKYPFS